MSFFQNIFFQFYYHQNEKFINQILSLYNYHQLRVKKLKINIKNSENNVLKAPENLKPIYTSIVNLDKNPIDPYLIINNRDWSSNQKILETIFKDKKSLSQKQKALTLLKYVAKYISHDRPPFKKNYNNPVNNPVNLFNLYGYSYCGQITACFAKLCQLAKLKVRVIEIPHHTVTEVFFNNSWHMLDPDFNIYFQENNKIISLKDLYLNQKFLKQLNNKKLKYNKNCFLKAFRAKTQFNKLKDLDKLIFQNSPSQLDFKLPPKSELRFFTNLQIKHYWKDYQHSDYGNHGPSNFTNGFLISPIKSTLYKVKLPFPILASYIFLPKKHNLKIIKFQRNKNKFKSIKIRRLIDLINLEHKFPIGPKSLPTYNYSLKIKKIQSSPIIITLFQLSKNAVPYLSLKKNSIKSVIKKPNLKVIFTYSK